MYEVDGWYCWGCGTPESGPIPMPCQRCGSTVRWNRPQPGLSVLPDEDRDRAARDHHQDQAGERPTGPLPAQ